MNEFNNLINQSNKKRIKVYYNLNELVEITGMSIRALKYRMLDVKRKYNGVISLLEKRDRQWRIHFTIIDEFQSKYFLKKKAIYNYKFQSIATWNPRDNYDVKYHLQLIHEIKEQLPNSIITYAIEVDSRGFNHTHLLSNVDSKTLTSALSTIFNKYLLHKNEVQFKVENIRNRFSSLTYIKKAPIEFGTLK